MLKNETDPIEMLRLRSEKMFVWDGEVKWHSFQQTERERFLFKACHQMNDHHKNVLYCIKIIYHKKKIRSDDGVFRLRLDFIGT